MDTDTLNNVLFSNPFTRNRFLGTFPACAPICTRKKIYGFITNTEKHDESGEHWCAWWVKKDHAVFFDSFGRPPTDEAFPRDFRKLAGRFKSCSYIDLPVQLPGTTSCGHFCADFIYRMCRGKSVTNFLLKYSEIGANDDIVRKIFKTL